MHRSAVRRRQASGSASLESVSWLAFINSKMLRGDSPEPRWALPCWRGSLPEKPTLASDPKAKGESAPPSFPGSSRLTKSWICPSSVSRRPKKAPGCSASHCSTARCRSSVSFCCWATSSAGIPGTPARTARSAPVRWRRSNCSAACSSRSVSAATSCSRSANCASNASTRSCMVPFHRCGKTATR
jgi:hypothetical protein